MSCCCCCVCPAQETVAIVENCGKFSHIAHPGFNCLLCCLGASVAGSLSLRVQQLDVKCETKTKDNVFVNLVVSVQYQVQREAVYDAYYRLTDSRQQISAYVFDEVRAAVPKMSLDDTYELKDEIAKGIKDALAKSMSEYGYLIIHVLVNDIARPQGEGGHERNQRGAADARCGGGEGGGGEGGGGQERRGGGGGQVPAGPGYRAPAPGHHQRAARFGVGLPERRRRHQLQGGAQPHAADAVLRHAQGPGCAQPRLHSIPQPRAGRRQRHRQPDSGGVHGGQRRRAAWVVGRGAVAAAQEDSVSSWATWQAAARAAASCRIRVVRGYALTYRSAVEISLVIAT
ncbi:hypothetical protein CHLRE_16g690879v5 [Chlamydomonas reinhardtii]|uniref:Band 7 domain-containing protein n=1 Tax=Chlamydomonas reinhardtii TaxID=3055 RepID=A0A2K3CW89_CHLRE|nr:uncharacterized protein CHLRE_16g690879v5 [Chlamydomonas reinhardtii]PNW72552.1 hypothetical protein CHLRE_16g690879v5 [Chlamydomonas reinhardtii]